MVTSGTLKAVANLRVQLVSENVVINFNKHFNEFIVGFVLMDGIEKKVKSIQIFI